MRSLEARNFQCLLALGKVVVLHFCNTINTQQTRVTSLKLYSTTYVKPQKILGTWVRA